MIQVRISDLRSLRSCCIKGTGESMTSSEWVCWFLWCTLIWVTLCQIILKEGTQNNIRVFNFNLFISAITFFICGFYFSNFSFNGKNYMPVIHADTSLHTCVDGHIQKASSTYKHHKDKHCEVSKDLPRHSSVVKKCRNKLDCVVHEMFFIRELKPTLKVQRKSNSYKSIFTMTLFTQIYCNTLVYITCRHYNLYLFFTTCTLKMVSWRPQMLDFIFNFACLCTSKFLLIRHCLTKVSNNKVFVFIFHHLILLMK